MTEHDLQAANIDRLKDVCGKRVAEFVQVPVAAARRFVAFVGALDLRECALTESVDGVFPFTMPAVQSGSERNLFALFEQMPVGIVAFAVVGPRRVRWSREDQKRITGVFTLSKRGDQ